MATHNTILCFNISENVFEGPTFQKFDSRKPDSMTLIFPESDTELFSSSVGKTVGTLDDHFKTNLYISFIGDGVHEARVYLARKNYAAMDGEYNLVHESGSDEDMKADMRNVEIIIFNTEPIVRKIETPSGEKFYMGTSMLVNFLNKWEEVVSTVDQNYMFYS